MPESNSHLNFDQLVVGISEATAETFGGLAFHKTNTISSGGPNAVISGSERSLAKEYRNESCVEVTEQYLLVLDADGNEVPKHYIQVDWDKSDELASIELDEGGLNEGVTGTLSDPIATTLARRILQAVIDVRIAGEQGLPDTDIEPFERLLAVESLFAGTELNWHATHRIERALTDETVLSIASIQLEGDEFSEEDYGNLVAGIRMRYDLTLFEVDAAIDMKMQQLLALREAAAFDFQDFEDI